MNLRWADRQTQNENRRKLHKSNTTGYSRLTKRITNGRVYYRARLLINGKDKSFSGDTAKEANDRRQAYIDSL